MALELDEEVLLSHFDFSESFSQPLLTPQEKKPQQHSVSASALQPNTTHSSQSVPSQLDNETGDETLTPPQRVHKEFEEFTVALPTEDELETLSPTQRVHHEPEETLTPTQRVHKEEADEAVSPTQLVDFQHRENERLESKNTIVFDSPMKRQGRYDDSGIVRRGEVRGRREGGKGETRITSIKESLKRRIDAIDPSVYSILLSQPFLQNKRERGKYSSSDFDFKATCLPKEIPGWYHRKKTTRNQTLLCASAKEKLRPPQCQYHIPSNHSIFFSHRWLPDDRSSFESDLVVKLENETQQRIFFDKTCLRTGHIINRFLGSLYDCKVILLYINDWTMKVMKDKLFKGEEDYVFLEWQLACLHTTRGGTVIPILEGVTLSDLRSLPMTSYPTITLEEFEDMPYSHIGEWLSSYVAITISPTDPATIQPLCDAILKALVPAAAPVHSQMPAPSPIRTWPPPPPTAPLRTIPCAFASTAQPKKQTLNPPQEEKFKKPLAPTSTNILPLVTPPASYSVPIPTPPEVQAKKSFIPTSIITLPLATPTPTRTPNPPEEGKSKAKGEDNKNTKEEKDKETISTTVQPLLVPKVEESTKPRPAKPTIQYSKLFAQPSLQPPPVSPSLQPSPPSIPSPLRPPSIPPAGVSVQSGQPEPSNSNCTRVAAPASPLPKGPSFVSRMQQINSSAPPNCVPRQTAPPVLSNPLPQQQPTFSSPPSNTSAQIKHPTSPSSSNQQVQQIQRIQQIASPPTPSNLPRPPISAQVQQNTSPLPSNQQVHLGYQSARGIYSLRDYILPTNPLTTSHSNLQETTPGRTSHASHHSSSHTSHPTYAEPSNSEQANILHITQTTEQPVVLQPLPPPLRTSQEIPPPAPTSHPPIVSHPSPTRTSAPLNNTSNPLFPSQGRIAPRKRALHDSHDFGGTEGLSRFKTLRISH